MLHELYSTGAIGLAGYQRMFGVLACKLQPEAVPHHAASFVIFCTPVICMLLPKLSQLAHLVQAPAVYGLECYEPGTLDMPTVW